ncbi:MAG: hypothetical protein LC789_06330 [Actinobacteria bacterium]|nr:hypothetical protein [Actinomycetota bacterium]
MRVLSFIDILAGLWLLAAPSALGLPRDHPYRRAELSCYVVGSLVLLLAATHGLRWQQGRGASRLNFCLGLFFLFTPVFFGYGHFHGAGRPATINAVVSGLVIVAGSALSLAGSEAPPPDRRRR